MARLEQHLEGALGALGREQEKQNSYMAGDGQVFGFENFENWEFQKILESEKPRLRGVLEALGPAGWYGFVTWKNWGQLQGFSWGPVVVNVV